MKNFHRLEEHVLGIKLFQNTFLFLCGSMLSISAYSQQDSLAIIKVLEKEGLTWRVGDKKAHGELWKEQPYSRILVSTADGQTIDVPTETIINPPSSMIGKGGFAFHSNHKMRIDNNIAWVAHDEVSVDTDGKETLSHEVRFLEKFDGNWKLVGQSNHFYNHPPENKIDTTSYIQTVDIETGRIETVLTIDDHFEAPNWHPDNYLIVNSKGKLYTLDLETKDLELLNTDFADQSNNDHGISPDNKWLA
jgi:TolB protein